MTETLRDVLDVVDKHLGGVLESYLFGPRSHGLQSLEFAISTLRDAIIDPPRNLIPIMLYCEGSFACAVCDRDFEISVQSEELLDFEVMCVVRWHLGHVPESKQGEVLDTSAVEFLESMEQEFATRLAQRERILERSKQYYNEYVVRGRAPRSGVLRPIQLACQNVIIGLALLRHDLIFDGLRVEGYVTSEVAHLAAGEPDRAMACILLCDAFQSGGTMEIRFGSVKHEEPIPASLVRYAKVRGIALGKEDSCAISPEEARDLFLAVTPMSDGLSLRAFDAIDRGIISPERLCYTLMSGVWNDLEAAFILATSARAKSIFRGGASESERIARSSEKEASRAALLAGLLLERMSKGASVNDASEHLDVDEDDTNPVNWEIDDVWAFVTLELTEAQEVPWLSGGTADIFEREKAKMLRVVPRGHAIGTELDWLKHLAAIDNDIKTALLIPLDAPAPNLEGVMLLRCPMTMSELDGLIIGKLQNLKVGRK